VAPFLALTSQRALGEGVRVLQSKGCCYAP